MSDLSFISDFVKAQKGNPVEYFCFVCDDFWNPCPLIWQAKRKTKFKSFPKKLLKILDAYNFWRGKNYHLEIWKKDDNWLNPISL